MLASDGRALLADPTATSWPNVEFGVVRILARMGTVRRSPANVRDEFI